MKLLLIFLSFIIAAWFQDTVKPMRDTVIKGNPKDTVRIKGVPDSLFRHRTDTFRIKLQDYPEIKQKK